MSILVIGGTGTVGSRVVVLLQEQGETISVLTHSPGKRESLPEGVTGVVSDLADPPTLQREFGGIEKLVLIMPVHPDEAARGQFVVKAARKAGVKKIVYLSVKMPPDSTHIPHFGSKLHVEKAIKESGIPFAILRPNHFFQNDLRLREPIMKQGIYPHPIGLVGLNRVDVRDIAEAIVNALLESGHDGMTYNLNGPDTLTGKDVAKTYGKHLGTEINYGGNDLDVWTQEMEPLMPSWMLHDFRIMFQYFQDHGMKADASELAQQEKVLHHQPRDFDTFVAKVVDAWKKMEP